MNNIFIAAGISVLSVASLPAHAAQGTKAVVERVAAFNGAMPTGVTVAPNGRIFVNFPQWGDHPAAAVAELKNSATVPYPNAAINQADPSRPAETLLSVQSVVADGRNRLWILDTAAPGFQAPVPGGAKLVAVDLATDQVVQTVVLPAEVVLPTTYVNDVRFDLRKGAGGVAYLTDSSLSGPGAIIVVDLAAGTARRRLSGHASTSPDPTFKPKVEGKSLMSRPAGGTPSPWRVASDGIAISADGKTLYYSALSSRHLYSVPTAALDDPQVSDEELAGLVVDEGMKGASDGLAEDDKGRIYSGDYEKGSIVKFEKGRFTTIAKDPRIRWPDTLSVGTDGYLYFTANQLYRQGGFNEGKDLRVKPYELLRVKVNAGPVLLR